MVDPSSTWPAAGDCHDLAFSERLLLCGIRLHVRFGRPGAPETVPALHAIFDEHGVASALSPLAGFIDLVGSTAMRRVVVNCMHATCLAPDEQLLLDIAARAQHGDRASAHDGLRQILPAAVARLALVPVLAVATTFREARLDLPLRTSPILRAADAAALPLAWSPTASLRLH